MTFPLRKWLILTHRYLGIVLSLLFVMWFVSGIAMIFARGMPGLTAESRLLHLPALDMSAVKVTAAEAAEKAQFERNRDFLRARSKGIPAEIERETAAIKSRFADPQPRMFPVAVMFLVPERMRRG